MSRGGPGRGQGRKSLSPEDRKRILSVRVSPDVLEWIGWEADAEGQSRGEIVEALVRRRMRRRLPQKGAEK